ncbi:hypothetical protein AYI69_g11372 [Smittium culicis]|uniref:Uncharacterized protein n=1 Tax=Smittium culicis TaxID=133412 RepID=A0A1R1WZ68_9FUNG|nr:hypothetical protein AYI69_g11372 [Smittium culicis]
MTLKKKKSERRFSNAIEVDIAPASLRIFLLFNLVLLADDSKDRPLAAFARFAAENEFVEDEVGLLEIEDEVELADVAEVLVESFDVPVDEFEHEQLIICYGNRCNEVQARIP